MAVAIGTSILTTQFTETLDAGGTPRAATITVTTTRVGAGAAASTIAYSPPSNMTEAELPDWQAFIAVVDEQVTAANASVDAVAVQAGT